MDSKFVFNPVYIKKPKFQMSKSTLKKRAANKNENSKIMS